MSLTYRITIAATAVIFALALFAGTTFAASNIGCVIEKNGADSRNRCFVSVKTGGRRRRPPRRRRVRPRVVRIKNVVVAGANTGGNTANKNTGGTVKITTGDADVVVHITNKVNP